MKLRVATFNANNLFSRAKVFQLPGFSKQASKILDDIHELSTLLETDSYKGATGARIKKLLERYEFHKKPAEERWFDVNQVRNKLFSIPKDKSGVNIVAAGRKSWVGWVELTREVPHEASIQNTGKVIQALKAHVICMVEIENRTALTRFDQEILDGLKAGFGHTMLIDGNDARGIDVGLLSQFPIRSIRSHVDDTFTAKHGKKEKVFSRDCAEYEVALPDGRSLWVLCNHFKSKGYGSQAANDEKRRQQARRVRDIVNRFDLTKDFVVVAGDLNDTPESMPLQDLFQTPHLHDVLDNLPAGEPRWTYGGGKDQIDYLLVSDPLGQRLSKVGIERHGLFSKNNFGGKFPHFPEVIGTTTQASDHAAVWADFDV